MNLDQLKNLLKTGTKDELFRHIFRNDLSSFIAKTFSTIDTGNKYLHNWHIDLIAEYLTECYKGNIKRLIINIPPRSLKSISVSVAFPAWILGHNPSERVIVASYSELLSLKHSTDCRLVVTSPWYKNAFPEFAISAKQNEKQKFATTKNGYRFATSVGGTLTGEGGNILIVDDPHNPQQIMSEKYRTKTIEWFKNTFSSRLNDKKKGVIIIVMQRLHENDLTGYLLKNSDEWHHLNLPAIATKNENISIGNFSATRKKGELLHSKREGESEIERAKSELGSFAFSAQYQQNPVIKTGGMIKPQWFKRHNLVFSYNKTPQRVWGDISGYKEECHPALVAGSVSKNSCHPELDSGSKASQTTTTKNPPTPLGGGARGGGKSTTATFTSITLSFDTSIKVGAKNDPTVCSVWGEIENNYYLLEIYREWLEYPDLKKHATELVKTWKADTILIEDKASGQSLIQDLKREIKEPIIAIKVTKDKITRLASVSALIEAGRVFLPTEAQWLADFEQEVYLFPNGEHDDQVDSMSQFLYWIKTKPAEIIKENRWRLRRL